MYPEDIWDKLMPRKLFVLYVKFRCNSVSCTFYSSPTKGTQNLDAH